MALLCAGAYGSQNNVNVQFIFIAWITDDCDHDDYYFLVYEYDQSSTGRITTHSPSLSRTAVSRGACPTSEEFHGIASHFRLNFDPQMMTTTKSKTRSL